MESSSHCLRPQHLGVAAELLVAAGLGGGVPSLDLGHGVGDGGRLHAHVPKELLEGVGAVEVLAAGGVALGTGAHGGLHVLANLVDGVLVPLLKGQVAGNLV